MELHTLGVNGGYTQNDVRELARVLTGWTVNPQDGTGFRFAPRLHDPGDKRVLGRTFSERSVGGAAQGEEAIRLLARQPATAHRIALRLAQFFVADAPPAALVERLAQSFLASTGDMRVVLRTLIEAPEFWQVDNQLFKTPLDYACSALAVTRSANAVVGPAAAPRELALALGFLANAGQPMHGWQTPDGYKTDAATWLAPEALTRRADFALALARRHDEPQFLKPFLSATTLQNIGKEAAPLRAALMLASPDFMRK
jgi:uncharacterized protein (DUF1800 family)